MLFPSRQRLFRLPYIPYKKFVQEKLSGTFFSLIGHIARYTPSSTEENISKK